MMLTHDDQTSTALDGRIMTEARELQTAHGAGLLLATLHKIRDALSRAIPIAAEAARLRLH